MAVEKVTIDGTMLAYEVIGEGGHTWTLTPGGRYTMESVGVRETAVALAELGNTVLIWDRPNSGQSEVCFEGSTESAMHADYLAALVNHLNLAPAIIAGGSAGARVSLLVASRHPEVARGLGIWWISGGPFGLMTLGTIYCAGSIDAVWNGGMQAVVDLPEWQDVLERTPSNRQRFLDQDPEVFKATFERWMAAYCPREEEIVPGLTAEDAAKIETPAVVFRSGKSDMHHPRATSEKVAAALPNARLEEPPWPDTEWIDRRALRPLGFPRWPLIAPSLHAWAQETFGPAD